MRLIVSLVLLLCPLSIYAQDFQLKSAKDAKISYERDLKKAAENYAAALDESAKEAIEQDRVQEAILIKRTIKSLTEDHQPVPKSKPRELWIHKTGYFEKLNDGYWVERVPNGVAHLFAHGEVTDDYIEISRLTGIKTLVRMYDKRCTYLREGRRGFEPLYKGSWEPK